MHENFTARFPFPIGSAREVSVDAGAMLFRQGESCDHYYIVSEGEIKVFARSPRGREVVLYRVRPGDICILTTSCILSGSRYPAEAIVESSVTAVAIPKSDFNELMAQSEAFRTFVLESFGQRLSGLISLIEQVTLESIEYRLAQYLLLHADENDVVSSTQEGIALEIGSAREVISRHLREFSNLGWTQVSRGRVKVIDRAALQGVL
ncbi:Crp/Fnr family transcriptional regulator [Pseudohalioglobus sediminis]|uniref:Crp/Fnr family transcriptional regulator n=1 Tax=Pseudohalioglobus sediminis TaxID=2606449 RepID=A0A5B0WZS3_9GAMM|nr:Crp/Fnr family transcriptional regulator [Pseudohalioglobus sediminis]KAA1191897.1 Crp/Fnr family transcriptional regulator [Pseudohalioglobus sediminis]